MPKAKVDEPSWVPRNKYSFESNELVHGDMMRLLQIVQVLIMEPADWFITLLKAATNP